MFSSPIYKRDSLGKVRVWQYEIQGAQWRTHAGILNGARVTSGWTTCEPKSQPTAEDQARFEANTERQKKLERDYHLSLDLIDTPNYFKPMLAQTYAPGKLPFPVYAQPKLDGIRCIATAKGLFSRQGKQIFGVPHIAEMLEPLFDKDPSLVLDGELYNHELHDDFNQITSIVRKQNPNPMQLKASAKLIQYHIYDLPSHPGGFGARHVMLEKTLFGWHPCIHVVDTYVVTTEEVLDAIYEKLLTQRYEGQIIRLDQPYEQKRSKTLLKRKEFQDAEFEIISVDEGNGNWAGYAKRLTCKLPDGRIFGAGIKGNQAFTQMLLSNRDQIVGRQATVRYFALTPDGIPRFPVAVDIGRAD